MVLRLAAQAMGTRFELVLVGSDETRLRAAGESALEEVQGADRRLSLFRRDSVLSHVNRLAAERPAHVDADTFALLALCAELVRASDGAFDPSVAPLVRAHGLHGPAPAGGAGDVDAARARVGWAGVELDHARRAVRFARPGMALDLGAVAKGWALDRAVEVLREAGVERALLHGGTSSVVTLGAPPDEDGWRVAIGADEDSPLAVLKGAALSVSAPHGRVAPGGATHVIDPRSGAPAAAVTVAAVAAESAALADAWSTALLVAGDALPPHPAAETLFAGPAPRRWRHRAPAPLAPRFTRIPDPQTARAPA